MKDHAGKETRLPARMEPFRAGRMEPPLPPLPLRHVFDWLMEVGPAEPGAAGQVPVSWREIDAWATRTYQRPSAWEARTIRRLSGEYLAEIHAAEDHTRPAPWSPVGVEIDRASEERRLRAVLG